MKKIIFTVACAALMVSCASRSSAVVDTAITEAKTLQALAKASNVAIPESVDSLIVKAEKQNDDNKSSEAFASADEAILQIHLSMLKKEHEALTAEKKKAEESLAASNQSLSTTQQKLKK